MYNTVGERIRELRRLRGLNQDQLAELTSLNRVTIAKYESGRVEPGAKALAKLADALDATVDDLLGRTDHSGTTPMHHARTVEARIVSGGMDKLPEEQRQQVLAVVRAMFAKHPELFEGDDDEA